MASESLPQGRRFFVLDKRNQGAHDTEFARLGSSLGPAPRCPQCGETIGSLIWLPPYQGELELHGTSFGDLLKGPCGGLLVTERFARDFKAEGLTGLGGFHPVEVTRVRRKRRGAQAPPPPPYVFVTPAYGRPALDLQRSSIRSKRPAECVECRYTSPDSVDGLVLELETWSGEDVFRPRGLWGVILVSERFLRFVGGYDLAHMSLVPSEKYVWNPLDLLPSGTR